MDDSQDWAAPGNPGKYSDSRVEIVTDATPPGVLEGVEWIDHEPRYGLTQAYLTQKHAEALFKGMTLAVDVGQEYIVFLRMVR